MPNPQVQEISNGLDLFLRDRFRKAYALLPGLLAPPRLPFLPPLPAPSLPPLFVPGIGLVRFVRGCFCSASSRLKDRYNLASACSCALHRPGWFSLASVTGVMLQK